jgi:hypothetical protein
MQHSPSGRRFRLRHLVGLAIVAAAAQACSGDSLNELVGQHTEAVTFNGQSRTEYLAATTERQHWANSVGILVGVNGLPAEGCDTFCQVGTEPSGYCSAPLNAQDAFESTGASSCTTFLIGADLFATAGHCIQPDGAGWADKVCANLGVAMRWRGQTATFGSDSNTALDEIHIYRCRQLIAHGGMRLITAPGDPLAQIPDGPVSSDWAVFQVDRPVRQFTGSGPRVPLPLATAVPTVGGDVALIGHPDALPVKIDPAPTILAVPGNDTIAVSADVRPGSSGSPIINEVTKRVDGIFSAPPSELNDDILIEDVPADCIQEFDCNASICSGAQGVIASRVEGNPAVRARLSTRTLPDADGDGIPESVTVHTANEFVTIAADFSGALGNFDVELPDVPVDATTEALPILLAVGPGRLVIAAGTTALSFVVNAGGISEDLRFSLISDEYQYITTPDAATLLAVNAAGQTEVYSLGDGTFGGTGTGSASEYVMILIDQTGSMTQDGTAEGVARWDDAISAASAWVQLDTLTSSIVNRAYAIWTFKQDSNQSGAVQIWPEQDSPNCPSFEDTTGFCVLGTGSAGYDDLLGELENVREAQRAVPGPSTPLARSLCESLEKMRTIQAFKRIILESDGGENATLLAHACGGLNSEPFDVWNTLLSDWGMSIDSWQAKVVRRATRISDLLENAVEGQLTASDAFPVDLAWHVDVHFGLVEPGTSFSVLGNPLEFAAPPEPVAALVTVSAAPPNADIDPAEYGLFSGLGSSTAEATFGEYVSEPGTVFGVDHAVPGDVDDSGCTSHADLSVIRQSDVWMRRAVPPNQMAVRADLTRDGWVNLQDVDFLMANWGAGCQPVPPRPTPDHCSDDYWSGNETDIDCGGSCTRCLQGFACRTNADCATNQCLERLCVAPEPLDMCLCNPPKCQDCTNQINTCMNTPGCAELVRCTLESTTCRFPHENCSNGQSCHQIVGYPQSSTAGQRANNVISCMGGC